MVLALSNSLMLRCQDASPQLSPRELFYREQAPAHDQGNAAPRKHVPDKGTGLTQKTPSSSATPQTSTDLGDNKRFVAASAETSSATAAAPEVPHLGLKYSLLLVDKSTGDAKPVSSSQVFDQGECFGLELQANRSGYLYVFNLGSSGNWKPLLPNQEMPEEGNFVPGFTTVRIPSTHCFRIAGPPGGEHLFVVLSRNVQDVNDLNRSIRNGGAGEPQPSPQHDASVQVAALVSDLNKEVQKLVALKGRDLEIQEVGATPNASAPPPAVYVVHTSSTPSDKVMTEIKITHR
jgi:hypothetical protein